MAEYVVYVNVDQMRLGTELSVATTFARCGFKRATRQEKGSAPLATLLFVGESSFGEGELARFLEEKLRYDTMCEVYVIVFQMAKLRSRSTLRIAPVPIDMAPSRSA